MICLVFMSVVLGFASSAPQGFPQETYEHQLARDNFIREYNRLAALAAAAPDINIIMASNRIPEYSSNQLVQYEEPQQVFVPNQNQYATNPAYNAFAFSANLGTNEQFFPSAATFPAAGNLGGHLAGHQVTQSVNPHPGRWTGALADTVPAGVYGLPQQVTDTPAVKAAKNAHFAAFNAALQNQAHHRF